MNLRRVGAVARKEFLHILRDPRSLAMGIAMPMILLLLFGYALTLDVDNVPIAVWDQSRTPDSRDLVARFHGSRYFSIAGYAGSYGEIERAIDRRQVMAALVIPPDFARRVRGNGSGVQLIVDGTDANTASLAIGYAQGIASSWSFDFAVQRLQGNGQPALTLPVDLRPRIWFNEDLESRNYIVPGLIAIVMAVIAALLTSLTIAREWETGTMEQLISTPLRGHELISGKIIPYFVMASIDVAIAVSMGMLLFHVPFRGSPILLMISSAFFLVGALCLGLLISIVTKSQLLASQIALVGTFLPAFLLSGFMFDIGNMPRPLQFVTYVIPARYFVSVLKALFLKGVGLTVIAGDVGLLIVFGTVMVVIAIAKFKKKLA